MPVVIHTHPGFEEEFQDLLCKFQKKVQDRLQKAFRLRMRRLSERGKQVIVEPYFEKLTGESNLYSCKLSMKNPNLRILFAFLGTDVVLLTIFSEKGRSDYNKAIRRAKGRLRDFHEGIV